MVVHRVTEQPLQRAVDTFDAVAIRVPLALRLGRRDGGRDRDFGTSVGVRSAPDAWRMSGLGSP